MTVAVGLTQIGVARSEFLGHEPSRDASASQGSEGVRRGYVTPAAPAIVSTPWPGAQERQGAYSHDGEHQPHRGRLPLVTARGAVPPRPRATLGGDTSTCGRVTSTSGR